MGKIEKAAVVLVAPLPSMILYMYLLNESGMWGWWREHPIGMANVMFFLNVNCLFWIIGIIQKSHWMIDLYWTLIPLMLLHYYASHPASTTTTTSSRSCIVTLLSWIWSLRLTHNYLRRENWELGVREDWRFSDMRSRYAHHWIWISFFAVYLSQQVFLMGICLPFYVIHLVDMPLSKWDWVATVVCGCGIIVAYYADTQLHDFVSKNKKLKEVGLPLVPNLEQGLWRYSRHPNYFGEQLWWWGVAMFAWNVGHGWTFAGPLINSMCLAYVTVLVEKRMLQQEYRAEAYRMYQVTTSVWIPWFKSSPTQQGKVKNT